MTAEVAFLSRIQKLNGMSAVDNWNVVLEVLAQCHDVAREMEALYVFK